jgi:hypothetical protein
MDGVERRGGTYQSEAQLDKAKRLGGSRVVPIQELKRGRC